MNISIVSVYCNHLYYLQWSAHPVTRDISDYSKYESCLEYVVWILSILYIVYLYTHLILAVWLPLIWFCGIPKVFPLECYIGTYVTLVTPFFIGDCLIREVVTFCYFLFLDFINSFWWLTIDISSITSLNTGLPFCMLSLISWLEYRPMY